MNKPDTWQYASRIWNELARVAKSRATVIYGDLGESVGQPFALALRHPLEQIQRYCEKERIPELSVLAINKHTGLPGSGFGLLNPAEFQRLCAEVYDFDWKMVPNPFAFTERGISATNIVATLVDNPEEAENVYTLVRDRGVQQVLFRQTLLAAYGKKCAFSGSRIVQGLDAVHLVPWSQANTRERMNPRNGILLNAWLHRLFDEGLLWLEEDYHIRVSPKALASGSDADRAALKGLDGKTVLFPRDRRLSPDPALIRKRNEIVRSKQ